MLDQAVKDVADFSDAWTNLAWARFQNGDAAAACAAAEEAAKRRPSNNSDQRPDRGERTSRSANSARYFPVFTKSRISSVSRVSPVLIEYTSDMWLCCGSIVARAQPFGRLQVACFSRFELFDEARRIEFGGGDHQRDLRREQSLQRGALGVA